MLRMTAKPPFPDQLEQAERQARAEQALTERQRVLQQQDGFKRAVEIYRASTARRPYDWQLHFNFGTLLNDFGDKPGAAAEFSTAVRFMPVFPALRVLIAQVLWDLGKRDEARHHLKEAVRLAPDYVPARTALAQAAGRLGR
jgi:tetratricopeptide (TPR) repeat protein